MSDYPFRPPDSAPTPGGCLFKLAGIVILGALVYFLLPAIILFCIGFGIYLLWAWAWAIAKASTER